MATHGVPSLNDRALRLAAEAAGRADELGVAAHRVASANVIDAGITAPGSFEAGLLVARICMADLATVQIVPGRVGQTGNPFVCVNVSHPVPACMASQYAGWQIKADKFFAMGSGPFRAAYGKEEIFNDIGFREKPRHVVGVLETAGLPTEEVVRYVAGKCGVADANVTLIAARTASMVGGTQVVARSVETAMHKLHALGFDLKRIVAGIGSAPLPPIAKNDMAAIGRTNDAVLYGGEVTLYVTGDDDTLADAGKKLPSSTSPDFGEPFAKIFKRYEYDFYRIDPLLFSPAAVVLNNINTGKVHRFGKVNHDVLEASFYG